VRAIEEEQKYEEKVQDVAVVQQAFPREKRSTVEVCTREFKPEAQDGRRCDLHQRPKPSQEIPLAPFLH
jgi:hypothetical protein